MQGGRAELLQFWTRFLLGFVNAQFLVKRLIHEESPDSVYNKFTRDGALTQWCIIYHIKILWQKTTYLNIRF